MPTPRTQSRRRSIVAPRRACLAAASGMLVFALSACTSRTSATHDADPELAAYVALMMPQKIEIQHFLSKPVSYARNGTADGVEAILAAEDALGDRTKPVGTFHFELYTVPFASGSRLGQRIAFWTVKIDSESAVREYWDRLTRFYQFPLKLDAAALAPGRYRLAARLLTPGGDTLFDEYEFDHAAGAAANPSAGP